MKKTSKIVDYQEDIKKLKKEVEDYKNRYLRALADYQNLEKRIKSKEEELKKQIENNLIVELLTIADDLEKAEIFIKDDGLKQIKNNFFRLLKLKGVEEIAVLGKEFNPNFAEAVEVVDGKEDNLVVEVIKKGYQRQGRVIRPAQVKVSRKKILRL